MHESDHTATKAFSLVELSIVLVILGLLVGGVLSGQSLIKAAQLRSVSSEYQRYSGAVNTFRDKYFAVPGDMSNATSFWGIVNATPATCKATASTDAKTCDGDGNGQISPTAAPASDESMRFWQHLANAGLIEGRFTGTATTFGPNEEPASKVGSSTSWLATYVPTFAGDNFKFPSVAGNGVWLWGTADANNAALSPEDAWNVDTKLDDGRPGTGRILSNKGNSAVTNPCTSVANTATNTGAVYQLSATGPQCNITFYF